jgi:hypothetical protein
VLFDSRHLLVYKNSDMLHIQLEAPLMTHLFVASGRRNRLSAGGVERVKKARDNGLAACLSLKNTPNAPENRQFAARPTTTGAEVPAQVIVALRRRSKADTSCRLRASATAYCAGYMSIKLYSELSNKCRMP